MAIFSHFSLTQPLWIRCLWADLLLRRCCYAVNNHDLDDNHVDVACIKDILYVASIESAVVRSFAVLFSNLLMLNDSLVVRFFLFPKL